MKTLIIAAALTLGATTVTTYLSAPSIEHPASYCQGFNAALEMINRNRDHYRALLGRPKMSQAEVLKWIYSLPWRDEGAHRTAPRTLGLPPGEPQIGPPDVESIDLYLMPGISKCSVGSDGNITYEMLERL